MMWGKPTASTTETEWRDWMNVATIEPIANHPVMGRKQRLEITPTEARQTDPKPTLQPCDRFGQFVKIGLTSVTVGSYGTPGALEENKLTPDHPSGMAEAAALIRRMARSAGKYLNRTAHWSLRAQGGGHGSNFGGGARVAKSIFAPL